MTTTPNIPTPDENDDKPDESAAQDEGAPGAEVGMSEDDGSTFEPEEDPEGYS